MPSRISVKTISTPDIQGDDSYIKYRPITINEARELKTRSQEIESRRVKALEGYSKVINKAVADFTEEDTSSAYDAAGLTYEVLDFVDQQFSKFILDWNWVDDNGQPLEKPINNYKVLGELYGHEYNFIMSLFQSQDNSKN